MLVGGQPVPRDIDMPSLIQMVTRLPSGFRDKISHPAHTRVDPVIENLLNQGKVIEAQKGLPSLLKAKELLWSEVEQPRGATPSEKRCGLYANLGLLHGVIWQIIHKKKKIGDLEGIDELTKQLRPLRQMSCELMVCQRGEKLDYHARRVEQGEVGFSAKERMGTDNVQECVTSVSQEPSRETACAHVEEDTDAESLGLVLEKLSPEGELIEVRLAGAKFSEHFPQGAVARKNVEAILNVYRRYDNVNIISSDLFNINQPTAMVVDPLTFELKEAVPAKRNPNRDISNGKVWVIGKGTPLHTCFDLTVSKDYCPVFLSSANVQALRERFWEKSKVQEWFDQKPAISDFQKPVFIERAISLVEAYKKALAPISNRLDEGLVKIEKENGAINPGAVKEFRGQIASSEIYVGHGAERANQFLMDLVDSELKELAKSVSIGYPNRFRYQPSRRIAGKEKAS